jgi:hypothetical protein
MMNLKSDPATASVARRLATNQLELGSFLDAIAWPCRRGIGPYL